MASKLSAEMTVAIRCLSLAGLLFAAVLSAQAQTEYPRVEVFGGYSYANLDGIGLLSPMRQNANGWAAGVSINLYKHFGLTADFAGQFGDINNPFIICPVFPAPTQCTPEVDFSTNQFLFGPRFTLRGKRFTGFGHTLFGVHRRRIDSSGFSGGPGVAPLLFPSVTDTDFALGFGGGLDINLGRRFSLRALQADYIPVRTQGLFWSDNVRLQTGVVVKLGSIEQPTVSQHQPGTPSQAEYPRAEVFAGYSFMRVERIAFPSREAAHGWATSASLNFHRHFGVVADFAGQYGDAEPEVFPFPIVCVQVFPPSITCVGEPRGFSNYQFLFGPRLTARTDRVTGFGHVLFGGNYIRGSGFAVAGFPRGTSTEFAIALGGGLDVNVGRRLAIRVAQIDYLPVRDSGRFWADNLRLQTGVVFKFGSR